MPKVVIYSKVTCPYCDRAKDLFKSKGISYEEILMDNKPDEYAALKQKTGLMTVPQIFINDQLIGGFTDLAELNKSNKLDEILKD